MTTDQLIGNPVGTELVGSVMQEVIAAAQAVGVRLGPELIEQKLQQTRTMGAYRSSMQIDRQQRRPMEIEAIVGNPLRAAQSARIAVPRLEMLYRTLRLIEDAFAAGGGR
jgi:2-dehydropantoate 2-reductase